MAFRFENYIGGDIVPQYVKENNERYGNSRIKFIDHDIVNDLIPYADLLFVRDVIGHYPLEDGKKLLSNLLNSNCKYLLTTTWYNIDDKTYYLKHVNKDVPLGRWYNVNLMSEPFNMPEPEYIIEEVNQIVDYDKGVRKVLALWNLEKLKAG